MSGPSDGPKSLKFLSGLQYTIDKTWDGNPIDHDPINIQMKWHFEKIRGKPHKRCIIVTFQAPLFDDPPAPEEPSGILPGVCKRRERERVLCELWDHEVVEFFFANDDDKYLEVEVGPHGHWLCLLLDGKRKPFNNGEELELEVTNRFVGNVWNCEFQIPLAYLPGRISKFNAYAIHGTGDDRVYEALYPCTDGTYETPDFHRLQFFRTINIKRLIPEGYGQTAFKDWKYGELWAGHE